MAQDINLLSEITEEETRTSVYTRRVNFFAIASLLVVGSVLLALFGYWLFLAANAERLKTQTREAEETILSQSRKEITRRSLVERLDKASKFLNSVIPYSASFEKITEFFASSGTSLKSGEFKDDGDLTLEGEFSNPSQFKALVDKFVDESQSENFGSATLISLRKNTNGSGGSAGYVFSLGVKYLKKGLSGATVSSTNQ